MIRVLSLWEWAAITPYSTSNVTVGNGVNWTSLIGANPNRWCLILSASLGNANVMPGPKPGVANVGMPLGSPTSFPASYFFRATDVGQMCQDQWWGAGTSGTNNVQVTEISYRPGPDQYGIPDTEHSLCQRLWETVKRLVSRWELPLPSSWDRARLAGQLPCIVTPPLDIPSAVIRESLLTPVLPFSPGARPTPSLLTLLAHSLQGRFGQSPPPPLLLDLLNAYMADRGGKRYASSQK